MCGSRGVKSVPASDTYYTCEELTAATTLSVTVWAVNGAGTGERALISTSTACEGGLIEYTSVTCGVPP